MHHLSGMGASVLPMKTPEKPETRETPGTPGTPEMPEMPMHAGSHGLSQAAPA